MKYQLIEISDLRHEYYEGLVYDIEVSDDESYNIDGVCVHNSACSTSNATAIGAGGISILKEIFDYRESLKQRAYSYTRYPSIIADGGIRFSGDVVKALCVGADFVMLGRLLSGYDESPGDIINEQGNKVIYNLYSDGYLVLPHNMSLTETEYESMKKYKLFRGLASATATEIINKINGIDKYKNPEGIETKVEYKGKVEDFLLEFVYGIKSAFSYLNCLSVSEFHEYFKAYPDSIVELSHSSFIERKPKIN